MLVGSATHIKICFCNLTIWLDLYMPDWEREFSTNNYMTYDPTLALIYLSTLSSMIIFHVQVRINSVSIKDTVARKLTI